MTTYFTLSEAAAVTNRSRVTLRRYLDQGRFPNACRDERDPNRQWLIPASDLESSGAAFREPTRRASDEQSQEVRLAVAEAVASERADALRQLTDVAAALLEQAHLITTLLAEIRPTRKEI